MATSKNGSTGSGRVRASRDGDRFHYTWAAARLLQLLSPASNLQQVSVEGLGSKPSDDEPDGAEVIDLVEFYGLPEEECTSLEVRQFKHSTLHPDSNFTLGEVRKVLKKFAQLDTALRVRYPHAGIRFSIVTNTPIAPAAVTAVRDLATGQASESGSAAALMDGLSLGADRVASLCARLELRGGAPGVTALRRGLNLQIGGIAADADLRVSASLVDLVASRASTESSGPILAADVLTAFGCRQDELAPAPSLLEDTPFLVRDAYRNLADRIQGTVGSMVVTAEGGVGKSTFARALPDLLRDRADVVIYDCFGNGDYRNPVHSRHRHRDGFVQLATEIAALGLGLPIIHAGNLAPEEYTKAFVRRLHDASEMLRQMGDRQLIILVDAADNAVIAADDNAGSRAFVRDLLRLEDAIPSNVRIVLTCRPERLESLEPPAGTVAYELPAFTPAETARIVSEAYPSATNLDLAEIHDRTSGNPRVVSTVLSGTETIHEALGRLAGLAGAASPLDSLMQEQARRAFDNAGRSRLNLERAAQLLTLLRPSVQLDVLATLAGTQAATVRSFISDLGRGLLLDGQSVQFLDEPTETYFRERHSATPELATQVASQLRTLSSASAYAASSLPEVLWSAGRHDELLALVASDDALPSTNDVERTQVENLRVEFGLRAAVHLRRPDSIVQLAMRAGAGRAGKSRQFTIIRDNPDLAGSRMDSRVLSEVIASRELPQDWPGSTLGAEAVMLAYSKGGSSTARSRARQAASAIAAWARAPRERRSRAESVSPEQVAHIALAILRTDGPALAGQYLSGWRPARFVLESSAALARTLLSGADHESVIALIVNSEHPALQLGVFAEMQRVGMTADPSVVRAAWTTLKKFRARLTARDFDHQRAEDTALRGAAWLCALSVRYSIADATVAAARLRDCLPSSLPAGLGDRHGPSRLGLLFAVALRADLAGEVLDVGHYRPVAIAAGRGKYDPMKSNDEDLDRYLRPALGWLSAWSKYARGALDPQAAVDVIDTYPRRHSRDDTWSMTHRVARQVLPLLGSGFADESVTIACSRAIQAIAADIPIPGAIDLIPGLHGDTRFGSAVLGLSNAARVALATTAEAADGKAETLVRIARGLRPFSQAEAGSYFDQAVRMAAGVGDDAIYRWDAVVALTRAATGVDLLQASALAERVARLGEAVEPIMYEGVNQPRLVSALALLSGANILRILGRFRDCRFGQLDSQLRGLVEDDQALFAGRPELIAVLAPFSTSFDLNTSLHEYEIRGGMDATVLAAVNNLAGRLGRHLEPSFTQSALPDPPQASGPNVHGSTTFDRTPFEQAQQLAQVQKCKAEIAALDLTQPAGVDAAIQLQRDAYASGDSLFAAEVFSRPELQWGAILDAALSSDSLGDYELARLLNTALARPRAAQSFVDSLKNAVGTYVDRHGARLLHHNLMSFDLPAAADLLEMRTSDLLQRALDHLNLEEALIDADHCYMLAAGASAVLEPSVAARVLSEAVASFEEDLDIAPLTAIGSTPSDPIDTSVAKFLWGALGDPRSAVRWQAAHAVRTAIELGASDVVDALCEAVIQGDAAGYADERFHFYQMSAAEWFLVAVERVARDDPSAIDALISAVTELSNRYPDHAAIQRHCHIISQLAIPESSCSVGTDWGAQLAEAVLLESWSRPAHASPMMKGAPKAEHRFDSDFDEYVLGKLTNTLVVTHQEVLDAASALILDEWAWRGSGDRLEDARRTAAVYEDGETYGYKWDVPKAEDLDYYLERHAALTIAGRLMRTAVPYRDPDAEQPDVLGWLADFDIARQDGRWIADQRSSVPGSLVAVGPRGQRRVNELEFSSALTPADGWVTVWQSAAVADYDRSLSVHIASALVNTEASGALLRALQTGNGYWSFRIPSADPSDEDFQFASPPFQLRGWVSTPNTEGGIDRLDHFAAQLTPDLPRPSVETVETLRVASEDGGARWQSSDDGTTALAAETWADISPGREPLGPSGYRLRITNEALDELLRRFDSALVVEVRVMREDRRDHYADVSDDDEQKDDGEGGDHDRGNDFRVFSYRPGAGWSAWNGRVGAR
ncbi:MAG: hypothetical protein ACRDT7_00705 [Microbacterium sp.]